METLSLGQRKSLRVLLVDDDSFALRVVRHILYELDVGQIEEAFNGKSAIEKLAQQDFDLLITDVEMPKLNGLGLIKAIRCGKTRAPRDLPIIITTILTNSEVLGISVVLDVNGFLAKPMRPISVDNKISAALNEIISTKPISEYELVETDLKVLRGKLKASRKLVNASILLDQEEKLKKEAAQSSSSNIEGNRFFIRELKPGMRICQDIVLKDNSLLLKTGYTLTETTINRLVDLREVLQDESVLVMPEDAKKST
jgi:CheY-like chemotaxis protein